MRLAKIARVDWITVVPILVLLSMGYVVLYTLQQKSQEISHFSTNVQIVASVVGLVVLFIAARNGAAVWHRFVIPAYLISIVLLLAVLFFGRDIQGSRRWLDVGQWQFQASELAKYTTILIQAKLLVSRKRNINSIKTFSLSLILLVLPVSLILLEPDLGTGALMIAAWLIMIISTNIRKRYLLSLLAVLLLLAPIAYLNLEGYQQQRIDSFIGSSNLSRVSSNYNVDQAIISIGNGGLLGTGIDSGTQSSLAFVPSSHTDFIFSVAAEKLGFVGALAILSMMSVVVIRLSNFAWNAKTSFVRYFGVGLTATFGLQFIINVGMNLGLLPVTGLPLPFVSYGGTHILVSLTVVGLFLGASRNSEGAVS